MERPGFFIAASVLLVVVLIFTVYWYLNPRIVDFFANPSMGSPNPPMGNRAKP